MVRKGHNNSVTRVSSIISENYNYVLYVFYFSVLFFLANRQFIWLDEGCSLITTSEGFFSAIKYSFLFEKQPPLYFALLNLWRSINDSIIWARLFSIIFVALSIIPIRLISNRVFSEKPNFFIWFFLLNPFTVVAALEIRYISLMIFFAAFIEYLFIRVYQEKQYKYRVFYILTAILGVYTQYFMVFLLIANFLVLVIKKNKSAAYIYLIDMIFPVISVLLFVPYLNNQISSNTLENSRLSMQYLISFNIMRLRDILIYTYKIEYFVSILEFVLVVIFLFGLFVKKPLSFIPKIIKDSFFIKAVLILIFLNILIIPIDKSSIQVRHMVILYIPVLLTFYKVLNNYPEFSKRILMVLIACIYIYSQVYSNSINIKGEEYSKIVDYIERSENNNQSIFLYRNDLSIVLQFLYDGRKEIIQIPKEIDFENYGDMNKHILRDKEELSKIIDLKRKSDTIWLVNTTNSILFGIDFKNEILEEFIEEKYIELEGKTFNDIKVRKLSKKRVEMSF